MPLTRRHRSHQAFVILTLLTGCVFICWSPTVIYLVLANYFHITSQLAETVCWVLFVLESTADPILFAMALHDLAVTLKATCRRCASAMGIHLDRFSI